MEIGILILVLLALAGRGETKAPAEPEATPPAPQPPAAWPPDRVVPVGEIEGIARTLGLSSDWGTFLAVVAEGESRRHLAALNEGDASAARKAYERNAARYANCHDLCTFPIRFSTQ